MKLLLITYKVIVLLKHSFIFSVNYFFNLHIFNAIFYRLMKLPFHEVPVLKTLLCI